MKRSILFASVCIFPALIAAEGTMLRGSAGIPEQVWITTTGREHEMAVSWVTLTSAAAPSTVAFGFAADALNRTATGTSNVFDDSGAVQAMRVHTAVLSNLAAATEVFYSIASETTVRSFVNEPARPGGKVYAVFADLGLVNNVALETLIAEATAGSFDAVIHAGDFAYNLEDKNGQVGNDYMNSISPVVSRFPYYVCAGNHETEADNSFANYLARFNATSLGLGANSKGNALWYSFSDGPVHWIFVHTEVFSYGSKAQIAAQKAWLTADLENFDRSVTPWLVIAGHKGYFEKNTDWSQYFDDLFAKYQVDLFLTGHTHNYQRLRPVVNEAASDPTCLSNGDSVYTDCVGTTIIVAGSPGCSQDIGTKLAPKDVLITHQMAYGYGYLTANTTHLHWYWFETAAKAADGVLRAVPRGAGATDEAWFIKSA